MYIHWRKWSYFVYFIDILLHFSCIVQFCSFGWLFSFEYFWWNSFRNSKFTNTNYRNLLAYLCMGNNHRRISTGKWLREDLPKRICLKFLLMHSLMEYLSEASNIIDLTAISLYLIGFITRFIVIEEFFTISKWVLDWVEEKNKTMNILELSSVLILFFGI